MSLIRNEMSIYSIKNLGNIMQKAKNESYNKSLELIS